MLACLTLGQDSIKAVQAKLSQISKLDSTLIEPLQEAFFANGRLCLVTKFIGQGQSDLYQLANLMSGFSEAQIGMIAYQLLFQLCHFH